MIVPCGLVPILDGNILASVTNIFSIFHRLPSGLTTEVAESAPIGHEDITWTVIISRLSGFNPFNFRSRLLSDVTFPIPVIGMYSSIAPASNNRWAVLLKAILIAERSAGSKRYDTIG
jgi:hypothetical protein